MTSTKLIRLCLLPVALGSCAFAQEPDEFSEITELDETLVPFVVTASRLEESVFDNSYHVEQLDSETLLKAGSRTLPEALGALPGVQVQKTAHGHGSPYVRGFTAFRNLLLIDGIRFNNSIFREGPNQYWATIDTYAIDRLELIYGSGSTLYGSDAIGGTLNLFTKSSDFRNQDPGSFFQNGSVTYRFDTASESHLTHFEQNLGKGDEYGLHFGISGKSFGDVHAADLGTQKRTGYDEWNYDLRFDYALQPDSTLTFAHQKTRQDNVSRSHRTIDSISFEGTTLGDELRRRFDQERSLTYFRVAGEVDQSWLSSYEATLSFQRTEEDRDRIRADLRRDLQGLDVDTYGMALQLESEWRGGRLVYGGDFYRDEVDSYRTDYNADGSFRSESIQGPVGDDARYDLFGLYAQNRWENDSLTFTLGGRYTYAETDIGQVEDPETGGQTSIRDSFDNVVFNTRANYKLSDCLAIYGGIAQSFRAPNLSDLSRLDSARSNEIETPSPGLDPEKYLTYELGTHYYGDTTSFNASVFYTDIRDGITRQPTGNIIDGDEEVRKTNSGDGYVYGLELQGDWAFRPGWSLYGHFSWIDGEIDTFPTSGPEVHREPLSRLAPAMGEMGLRWTNADERFWIDGLVRIAGDADKLSTRDESDTQRIPPGGTSGYAVASLRTGWQANEALLLTLNLENLTDEAYRVHGSGQNEAGIGAVFGMRYSW